jgi:hypothetical protein
MTKTVALMVAGFLLSGIAGGGVRQANAQGESISPCTQAACPEAACHYEDQNGTDVCVSGPEPEKAPPAPLTLTLGAGVSLSRDALTLTVCIEALFVGPFSAQACGSGRGLLLDKRDATPELTHYRARLRLAQASLGRLWLVPIVQAGMSELRAGAMEAGYLPGRGSSRQLALGPAAGAALQVLFPLGKGLELVGDIHLEAAWIPRADELPGPQEKLQPVLGATLGIGF